MTRQLFNGCCWCRLSNSWLSRTWTFLEKRRTCERTALWAQALTLHLESEGATGAGWGGYWDDTEAGNKIPNLIIRWPFDFNGLHSLSLFLASTWGAQGGMNGKAITEPWLVGGNVSQDDRVSRDKSWGAGKAALGRKVRALQGSPRAPRTGNIHLSQGNGLEAAKRTRRMVGNLFRNDFCHHCWKWWQPQRQLRLHRARDAKGCGSTLSFSLI